MGLLDDLRSQVEQKEVDESQQQAELDAQQLFYSEHLRPKLLEAHTFFEEIVEKLNIVKPDIRPHYPLDPTMPRGVRLTQGDYEFDYDSGKQPRKIEVRCRCTLDKEHVFNLPDRDSVLQHTDLLDGYAFRHHRKDYRDEVHAMRSAAFSLEGPMHVHIRIQADAANRCILLELRNLEEQPVKRYRLPPEKFDGAVMERLARILIREESVLVNTALDEEVRSELRTAVEQANQLKNESLAQAYAEMEADRAAEEEARLVNRAKRALSRSAGKLSGLLNRE